MNRCLTYLILVMTASLCDAAPIPKEIRDRHDAKLILGKWRTDRLIHEGVENAPNEAIVMEFNAEGQCGSVVDQKLEATYKLDQSE